MTRNLKVFSGLVIIATVVYFAANSLVDHLSGASQTVASWILLILAVWVVFDLIVKVIYWFVGITNKLMDPAPPRLSHQQAAEVNKYWMVWLLSSVPVILGYTLIFNRSQWKSTLIVVGVVVLAVYLGNVSSRQKIAGHTKEQIFK